MPIETEPEIVYDQGRILRYRRPLGSDSGTVAVLLHGWTGDENSMWIFANSLPENIWILAPRGPIPARPSGFGWAIMPSTELPASAHWIEAALSLRTDLDFWLKNLNIQMQNQWVIGFSQGATMTYAFSALPAKVSEQFVCLSGFIPSEVMAALSVIELRGVKYYISHGSQDETVPVEKARQAVEFLETQNADVTYCESDSGHKIRLDCLKGMQTFLHE